MPNFTPKHIEKVGDDELKIIWEDDHESTYTFQLLRQQCPCALCRDETSGEPILDPETVPVSIRGVGAEIVGNYALSFSFSDGHGTGIFTFEALRGLCACEDCSYHPGSETN